ncbi:MAG: EFR1 family ferrodoxin [Thermoplasmatota archaeon]
MPSCAILYYSTTGNTKLACEYLSNRIPQVDFYLFDMKDLSNFDPSPYTFVGFATFTDYQAPPRYFADAVKDLDPSNRKEAFVLATYAGISGKVLKTMKDLVEERGYKVITGHCLLMPENNPVMRKRGYKAKNNPKEKELEGYRQFIRHLGDLIITKHLKGSVEPDKIKVGLFNSLLPSKIRTNRLKGIGKMRADLDICDRSGTCVENCAYGAITMQDGPVFDEKKCHACFACYNLCPVGAITCEKLSSVEYRYPGPSEDLKKRMSY